MTTIRHRSKRLLLVVAAVLALAASALTNTTATSAESPTPGRRVGHLAERGPAAHSDVSAPLSSITPARVVRRKHHEDSPLPTPTGPVVADPAIQSVTIDSDVPSTTTNFGGIGASGSAPSDANGAVGPNHYFDQVNARVQIFTKTGTSLLGPVPTNTLWAGFGGGCETENNGDGTVRYDALADRWVVGQFALGPSGNGPFYQCLAVSATGDPTGSYYRYAFAFSNFPDFPKLAVWPDGYYQTMNMFDSSGAFVGANTCVYERSKMLDGQRAAMQCINTTTAYGALLPGDLDGTRPPPVGSPNMQVGLGRDNTHLASFRFATDWSPGYAGTSLTETDLAVSAYAGACGGNGACVPQLGTTQRLDALADRLMYRYTYRNMGDHEAWLVTYSVDVAGVAAPRWFELRRTPASPEGPLTVYQDSTYAPDAQHRWMSSAAMDQSGNIALGYSKSSATMKPAIAYTGRLADDPLNALAPETILKAGAGAQTGGLARWGDYSSMSIDPSDGCGFWYTNQYVPVDGSFNWATQIGSFTFPSCVPRTDSAFSMAAFPVSGSVGGVGSTSTVVSTSRTAGTAQAITLSASGLPAGATVVFSPTSVTAGPGAGSSSTMTVTTSGSTPAGLYPITISGAGTSTSEVATFTLTVPGPSIGNGGFESGDLTNWTSPSGNAAVAPPGRTGAFAATLGTSPVTPGDSSISQEFVLGQPSTLAFWYAMTCPDSVVYDWATATLTDNTSGTTATLLPKTCANTGTWSQVSTSLGAPKVGHTFTLTLTSHSDENPADPTVSRFDDVVLTPSVQPDFTLAASPSSLSVVAGGSSSSTITIGSTGGFSGSVGLSVSGLPAGAGASFAPASVSGSGSSTLTIATTSATAPGTYQLTVSGASGILAHAANLVLSVAAPPDFVLSAAPSVRSVVAGSATSFTTSVGSVGSFNGSVGLSVAGLPAGASAAFTPTSIAGSGSSTVTMSTTSATAPGTYPLTITGVSGPLMHSTTVTLTVTPAPDFTVSVTPANRSVRRSTTSLFAVTVTPVGGFSGAVKLTVSSSAAGPSGSFSPATLSAGSSTLTVKSGSKVGTFTLTITGTSGATTRTAKVVLVVTK